MNAIAIAGPVAMGKTTISRSLATAIDARLASFGDYVRAVAQDRQLPVTRLKLEALGQEIIDKGWPKFCRAVLDRSGWRPGDDVVIDGVRHVRAVETLTQLLAPHQLFLVWIHASEDTRLRYASEKHMSAVDIRSVDNHPNEGDLGGVRDLADLVIVNDTSVDSAVTRIVAAVTAAKQRDRR